MKESFYIEIRDSKNERLLKDISRLNELLEKTGVHFETADNYGESLIIHIDETRLYLSTNRRAGRPRIITDKSIAEIYQYRKSHTIYETASFCSISVSTLNRRISSLKRRGLWRADSDYYWSIDD